MKIIRISTDLELTVHDFPDGAYAQQHKELCELIGNYCDIYESSYECDYVHSCHGHSSGRLFFVPAISSILPWLS